jgi:VWFA-related protein
VDVTTVTATFTVTDRNSAPVKDLRREDFTLQDDGKVQAIQSFWQESGLPLTIGLIADVSGSQLGVIRDHRENILQFLAQVMGPQDRAFLVTAGVQARLLTDLTGSLDELRAGVQGIGGRQREGTPLGEPCTRPLRPSIILRGPGCGGTVLWDAVYAASVLKMKPLTGRKALIVLSDGMDTGSLHNLTTTIEAAQSADTLVYTLRALSPLVAYSPAGRLRTALSNPMKRLSDETGGRAFGSTRNAPETFKSIEDELRNLYVIGFTPPDEARNGKFRKLEIQSAKPGLKIRARKGYKLQ